MISKIKLFFMYLVLIPKYWSKLDFIIKSSPEYIGVISDKIKREINLNIVTYQSQLPAEIKKVIYDNLKS